MFVVVITLCRGSQYYVVLFTFTNLPIILHLLLFLQNFIPVYLDTFSNLTLVNSPIKDIPTSYNFSQKGIAAIEDDDKYGETTYNISEIVPPPNWVKRYPNGQYTPEYPPIDPSEDELFQVWMRLAGLPRFRKLYGINKNDTMAIGTYELVIDLCKLKIRVVRESIKVDMLC